MHIGIVSHISTVQLSEYLHLKGDEPLGTLGATAPNLLIIELLKQGYTISVFTLSQNITNEYVVRGKNLTIYFLPQRKKTRDFALDLFKKERSHLKSKILEIKPDILHAHWQYEYSWAALDTGYRTIVTCRDSPVKVLLIHKNLYRFVRLIMAYIVLKKAKIITATSSYLATELKKFGVKKTIHVIPNFEPDWLFEMPIISNKDLTKPKIIMINNGFDNRKNVSTGIAAFQLFRKVKPDAELHLYGKGYEENGTAYKWAAANNLNTNVHYKGYRNFADLMQDLNHFTLLVHPSKEETFGNIITESMALGVPVIGGNNSGSIPWVVGLQQEGGLLVDITDMQAIANGMLQIIQDRDIYTSFCMNAMHQAKERFSASKIVEQYVSLYKNQK